MEQLHVIVAREQIYFIDCYNRRHGICFSSGEETVDESCGCRGIYKRDHQQSLIYVSRNNMCFFRQIACPTDDVILSWLYSSYIGGTDDPSLAVEKYPRENAEIRMGTAAYHAERELDDIMYQDSGIYRDRQYGKANALSLQTMYEEVAILWDQEVKYRPNFSTVDNVVNIPVIFAKVSGVKGGNVPAYWSEIKKLVTDQTLVVRSAPYINSTDPNPIKAHAAEFFKNGKLQRAKIKEHQSYPYGFLREEIQEHILDKLQLLIDQRVIKGTFENGMEYTIIATILNLKVEVVRKIQGFDFTKKNPKLIYINTTEHIISLEDSILAAFLNLAGFDVLFFVPTGYQNIEKYFNQRVMEEHQVGDYLYDLRVPDFGRISSNIRQSWRERIFKR